MSAVETVWAVEMWGAGHWQVIEGGLTREVARRMAAKFAHQRVFGTRIGGRMSIAEYTTDDGSSAISRIEVDS